MQNTRQCSKKANETDLHHHPSILPRYAYLSKGTGRKTPLVVVPKRHLDVRSVPKHSGRVNRQKINTQQKKRGKIFLHLITLKCMYMYAVVNTLMMLTIKMEQDSRYANHLSTITCSTTGTWSSWNSPRQGELQCHSVLQHSTHRNSPSRCPGLQLQC